MPKRGNWCPTSYRARKNIIWVLQALAAVLLVLGLFGGFGSSATEDPKRSLLRDARLQDAEEASEGHASQLGLRAEPVPQSPPGDDAGGDEEAGGDEGAGGDDEAGVEEPQRLARARVAGPALEKKSRAPLLPARGPARMAPVPRASDGGAGSEALRGQSHDGSLHEGEATDMAFIRIPLNGGQSLMDLAESAGLHFADHIKVQSGVSPKMAPRAQLVQGVMCTKPNVPPSAMMEVYGHKQTFCIVRDPYERLIAEFRRTWEGNPYRKVGCLDGLNTFVKNRLKRVMGDPTLGWQPDPYIHDCQFMPQSAFVFGWRNDVNQVDDTRHWCTHILSHASLQEEASELLDLHGHSHPVKAEASSNPQLCPMLTLRSLSVSSRELIETVYRDDFRLLDFEKITYPEFIHIPRTGGTTIEDVSQKYELWGRRSLRLLGGAKWMGPKRMDVCYPQHVPPSILDHLFAGTETFCIVRDVYKRLISEFGYWAMARFPGWTPQFDCNVSELNRFISERLAGKDGFLVSPHRSDCHLVPQAGFVYGWDRKHAKVNFNDRWCTNVIRYERFHEEINNFWAGHGYPMRLDTGQRSWTKTKGPCGELKPKHFTDTSVALIKQVYHEDFKMMDLLDAEYEASEKPTPLVEQDSFDDDHLIRVQDRVLVHEERELEKSTMIVNDLMTSEEFEISFDITLHKVINNNVGGILKVTNTSGWYGEPGDRMPAFLFGWNTSKIVTHMGKAGKPNDFCQSREGMPIGKTQHIMSRLQGSTYKLFVNGQESCTMHGFNPELRYPGQRNVQVWLYDQFNDPGIASIANLRYKSLGAMPP